MRWLDKLKAKNELKFFEGEEVENGHKNIVLGMVREKSEMEAKQGRDY